MTVDFADTHDGGALVLDPERTGARSSAAGREVMGQPVRA
jgi:hypothetical protein